MELKEDTFFNNTSKFLLGITDIKNAPIFNLPEIAFWGRSNVGKSSLINALLGTKKLVKTSSIPGKTKEINFFNVGNKLIIADLPGYGYAKVNKYIKELWINLVISYLQTRSNLKRIFLLLDSKVGIKPIDEEAMELLNTLGKSYAITLTKLDKLPIAQISSLTASIFNQTKKNPAAYPTIFTTSSNKKTGIKEIQSNIINNIISI